MLIALQLLQNPEAVELGHQHVEEQQVEGPASQQIERCSAVFGEDDGMPLVLEPAAQQKPVHAVVVRDQDCAGLRTGTTHETASDRRDARAACSVRYSCSMRSTSSETLSRRPALACRSTVRQSSANAAAPSVEPFDFRVCAARRSSSVSLC